MKQITPISIWINGDYKIATQLALHINFDNLIDTAVFYYSLNDSEANKVTDGNITMTGADYTAWTGSNDYAWKWAAETLGLTII